MGYTYWTPEEDKQAIRLYHQGKSFVEIGEIMGRSKASIQNRINKRLKITRLQEKEEVQKANKKRKFTEGTKIALGYYDNCVI